MFTISVWMRLCISGVGSLQPVDVPGDSGSPSANMLSPLLLGGRFLLVFRMIWTPTKMSRPS